MKFITYHSNKFENIGGVETLYRSIHYVAANMGFECIEIYSHQNENLGQNHAQPPRVTSLKIPGVRLRFFGVIVTAFSLAKQLEKIKSDTKNIFVCVDPRLLILIPKKKLQNLYVVLIQTGRIDKTYGRLATYILNTRRRYIDVLSVYTEKDKSRFVEKFPEYWEKIVVIPRGCKLDASKEPKNKVNRLITICRVSPEKQLSMMVDIVARTKVECHLDIYGDGPDGEVQKLRRKIERDGKRKVTFHGPAHDLYPILEKGGIFLMTSEHEGFGQTLIEARSQGLPIIAFDTFDALSTIVETGENGYIVNAFDKDEYARKIDHLLQNDSEYYRLSRNALKKARETENNHIENLWRAVIERGIR